MHKVGQSEPPSPGEDGSGWARGAGRDQGSAQAPLAHVPEVVLDAVDQRHRDHVRIIPEIAFGSGDVALLPGHAEIGGNPGDDLTRVVAQMAAGSAEQGDQGRCGRGHRAPLPRGLTFRARGWRGAAGGVNLACRTPSSITLVASTYGSRSSSNCRM